MMHTTCTKPPRGWRCTRDAAHAGPCAALPTLGRKLHRLWARMTGRVLVSDNVTIAVTISAPLGTVPKFNPDLIIGRHRT